MSKVSDVYAAFLDRVQAILPNSSGWNQLPSAYDIPRNPELYLKKGFCIAIGQGKNSHKFQSRIMSIQREIVVTISMALDATDSDAAAKVAIEKQLLENMHEVVSDLEINPTLNDGANIAGFESDSGINFVDQDKKKFVFIQGTFSVEYFETL